LKKRGESKIAHLGDDRRAKVALVMIMLLVGSAVAVYNADSLYLAGQKSLTSQLPSNVVPNATNTMMLLTTDGNGDAVADEVYTIELIQGNDTLMEYKGRTDARGFAAPSINVPYFEGDAELRVTTGDQVLKQTVSPVATSHIFLTTDKPIYQPGQTVHTRVLVLRGDHVATGSKAVLEVKTPEGDKVLRKTELLNDFGVAAFDYVLSDQLPLGNYEFRVTVDGQEAVRNVKVDEYVLPRFEINVGDMKPWYTKDETVDGYILAKYFFGQRVQGKASLTVNLFTGSEWVSVYETQTVNLEDGVFEFNYDMDNLAYEVDQVFPYPGPDSVLAEFNFTVEDTGEHVETESYIITLAKQPIVITTLADANVDGETSVYYVVVRFPNGGPVADAKVSYWLDDRIDRTKSVRTDDRGIAAITFKYKEDHDFLKVRVKHDVYEGGTNLALEESGGLKIVPDKITYQVGEVAHMSVFYSGEGATDLVYYDVVADGFTVLTGHISMKGTRTTLDIPITSDFGRLTSVRVYKVERNFDIARDVAVIGVSKQGDLDIAITPDKASYLPQQPVGIDIQVTRDGDGVAAVLGVSIVDNAVFELGSRFSGFEEVLQGLLPQYSDPIYQFMGYIFVGDTPLPTETLNEWRKVEAAPIETTAKDQGKDATKLQDRAVGAYWTILGALGIVALVAMAAMGPRTRKMRVMSVVVMLVVVSAGAAIVAIQSNQDENDFGTFFEGNGGWGGVEIAKDGGAADEDTGLNFGGGIPPFAWEDVDNANFKIMRGDDGAPQGSGSYQVPTKPSIVRQFFPETWAWIPIMPTDDSGRAELELTAPDSITSWDVSVLASTKDAKVGVGHQNVTVFQEFFVEPDLPAKAFLGDRFPLKVQVYNYGEPTDVEVRLSSTDWFDIIGDPTVTTSLTTGEVGSVEFTIELTKVGVKDLTVTGESQTFVDQVIRPLRVKPVGEKVTDLNQGRLSSEDEVDYDLDILPELIENSENAWVKLQGGVEAAVIEGADSYIHYVSGCGEQSLSTLSIDVLAFRTVREGELDEAKLLEFEMIVNQGITHELQYLLEANNGKGRGIVWFPGDQDVHPWLTSWGVITFKDAQLAGFTVDQKIIDDMQSWLLSQQKDDGSFVFPEWGIYEFNNPKLRSKTLATTAYVTHALMYSGISPEDPAIQDAIDYIKSEVRETDNWDDAYVLAIALKVLASGGEGRTPLADDIATQLHSLGVEENGTVFWGSATNMISNDVFEMFSPWDSWNRNPGFAIETTGYAAQALHAVGKYSADVEGAIKFLLDHRSSLGGYFSTQDTVVAFQTIYEVSTKQAPVDIDVEIMVDGEVIWTQTMDDGNRDLTFLFDLRPYLDPLSTNVHLRATGEGFVMFQVYLEQWVPWGTVHGEEPLMLELDYSDVNINVGDNVIVLATVTNTQDAPVKMALVELVAPVGMYFDTDIFEDLLDDETVDNVEYEDDVVRLYINDVEKGSQVTFQYSLVAQLEAQVTLAGCRVFDMYNALSEMELEPIQIDILP
jgi:uncharacterized protein YfaS (alpha-2-macroglobulin family)